MTDGQPFNRGCAGLLLLRGALPAVYWSTACDGLACLGLGPVLLPKLSGRLLVRELFSLVVGA
ncbi:hypothetical protein [Streptomyces sp. NPDC056399]|uniref:hypothetical protein n=1 Tax=Streptomyces sp. NPDC056399 TaxID=3345807 RepID=UPI0035DEC102